MDMNLKRGVCETSKEQEKHTTLTEKKQRLLNHTLLAVNTEGPSGFSGNKVSRSSAELARRKTNISRKGV